MFIPQTTREYHLPKANGVQSLTLKESPVPKLKANDVLVKIHAVSLNYRDLVVALGQYPLNQKENPVPGSDMSGEIIAVGQDVKGWNIGDRVCSNFFTDHIFGDPTAEIMETALGAPIDGVLTEYKILPAQALVKIPEHLSYAEASTLPCAALTAYNALFGSVPLKGGDTVLVQGTGGVSIFALQLAVASGAIVIATSSSDKKLEIAKKLGATHTINYKTTPDWDKEALKLTDGRGVDHVIDVGGSGTMSKSLNAVRIGGFVHVIGFLAGQGDTAMLPLRILSKLAVVRGIGVGSRTQFEDMNRFLFAVKMKPIVDKVFDFEDLQAAYRYLGTQQHVGKIVIKVSKD